MVSLNISNIPTPVYHSLLELKGKIHARTWLEVLMYAIQDPEGQIDFEVLKGGLLLCPNCGKPAINQTPENVQLRFRTGNFIHEYDGSKPKAQQINTSLHFQPVNGGKRPVEVRSHGKNR